MNAPTGEKIAVSEKGVLRELADDHREEIGVAWPSLGNLARRCCLSERQTRRVIARLERKGLLRRIPNKRDTHGGQTSNEYVFLAGNHSASKMSEWNPLVRTRRASWCW